MRTTFLQEQSLIRLLAHVEIELDEAKVGKDLNGGGGWRQSLESAAERPRGIQINDPHSTYPTFKSAYQLDI